MPTIRVDDEVFRALQSKAMPFVDSPNDVLRRLLLGTSGQPLIAPPEGRSSEELSEAKEDPMAENPTAQLAKALLDGLQKRTGDTRITTVKQTTTERWGIGYPGERRLLPRLCVVRPFDRKRQRLSVSVQKAKAEAAGLTRVQFDDEDQEGAFGKGAWLLYVRCSGIAWNPADYQRALEVLVTVWNITMKSGFVSGNSSIPLGTTRS